MPKSKDLTHSAHLRSGCWIKKEKRQAIYARDGMACVYCTADLSSVAPADITLDHLVPGAGNHASNLVTCCRACNTAKAGMPAEMFADEAAKERIDRLVTQELGGAVGETAHERKRRAALWISTTDLAQMLLTTTAEIVSRVKSGALPPMKLGKHDAFLAIPMWLRKCGPKTVAQTFAEEKARLAKEQANNFALKNLELRKQSIPLEILEAINDRVFTTIAGIIKAQEGKVMTMEAIGDAFTELREIGAGLKEAWR